MKPTLFLLLVGVFFSFLNCSLAQKGDVNPIFTTSEGAIKGYDPVAYFTLQKPVKGLKTIAYDWKGATWYFASIANKALFVKQPDKYAPQYGGWCAYGWAQDSPVKIEPEAWSIVNGKLYLNYDLSIKRKWDKDQQAFIQKADTNYSKALK